MQRRFAFVAPLLLGVALAACDEMFPEDDGEQAAAEIRSAPEVEARATDGYSALGGRVVDVALIPHAQPFLGRGLAALDGGGFAVIDFAVGESQRIEGPRVGFLAAAPDFQLRGSSAPLVIAAGGALTTPQAWVFLAVDGTLVDMPMDPIATDGPVRAMCAERATAALIDLIVFTDRALERWRVSDRGGDRLAAERVETTPADQTIVACADVNGEVVGVAQGGVTRPLGEARWGFSDGADVAAIEESTGWWAIVARPEDGGASLVAPLRQEVVVAFSAGLNTPSTPAPSQLAASPANFGGSFSSGLLVAAQDDRIVAIELGGLMSAAKTALTSGS
jgi:hypothetical protein